MTNIWLDDLRAAPEGWLHARNVQEAIYLLKQHEGDVQLVSLDHDLGGDGPDAPALVDWMVDNEVWPTRGIGVHSMNPIGRKNMLRTIDRYGPYENGFGQFYRGKWISDEDHAELSEQV